MVVCQRELPFVIDDKGGEKSIGSNVMIIVGVIEFSSMPKGEIFDQWLSLMSTQVTPTTTPIFHGNFDLTTYSIMS